MQNGVLFVDDEELLRAMYESFAPVLQEHYEVATAGSGEEAIRILSSRHFDVVVTDLTMPGMDGLQFISHIVRSQPDCARIIISGFAERIKVARCLFVGHRYFNKPCDMNVLGKLLLRLASFRDLISNEKVRTLVGGLGTLPGPPEMFLRLEKVLESPFSTLEDVASLVEQDPTVTAKLLQIVNSAQFGLRRRVISAVDAVQLVGLEAVRGLVLGLQAFAGYQNQFKKTAPPPELWDHSLRVAILARRIAMGQGFPQHSCERAFLAGLMHDVGRIVISANAPEEYDEVFESSSRYHIPIAEAETIRFGATHADVGAYLLTLWGIDDEVALMVQHQERIAKYPGADLPALAALHVAHVNEVKDPLAYPLDGETLATLGFIGIENWMDEAATVSA